MKFVKNSAPCNPNASAEVKNVMKYLAEITGKGLITGQHTKTLKQEDLHKIVEITGKEPALCGFELLAYSPNINYDTCDDVCLTEVYENRDTIARAWEWAEKGGLITFCWHWFSPIGGTDKAFYTEKTDFDPAKAVISGTEENKALIRDMDAIAELFKPFRDKHVPILWRPVHESEGTWFWWAAKGTKVAGEIYKIMYDRFTNIHKLDNLIWIWNAPVKEGYPGDDVVDIISMDLYPEAHTHTSQADNYEKLASITQSNKLCAIAEIGSIIDIEKVQEEEVPWCFYMTWCEGFIRDESFNSFEVHKKTYNHPFAITLDKLPKLY